MRPHRKNPKGEKVITCFIRYTIDSNKFADFEHYARVDASGR
jgi:hypothetical protein